MFDLKNVTYLFNVATANPCCQQQERPSLGEGIAKCRKCLTSMSAQGPWKIGNIGLYPFLLKFNNNLDLTTTEFSLIINFSSV